MGLTLGSIGGSNLGSAGDSSKSPPSPPRLAMSWGFVILRPVDVFKGIKFKTHFAKIYTEIRPIYFAADLFLPNSPRSSLHPNNMNRINKRMTALPNAKSTLPIAIDTVTRPYADATATTQETVSQVSSSNLSSIDDDGEPLVSSCLGRFSKKQLPSSFPLVTYYGRMHGKRRTGLDGVQRDNGQTRPRSSWP